MLFLRCRKIPSAATSSASKDRRRGVAASAITASFTISMSENTGLWWQEFSVEPRLRTKSRRFGADKCRVPQSLALSVVRRVSRFSRPGIPQPPQSRVLFQSHIHSRCFHHIQPVCPITDTPPAMPENGNNMIGEGTTVSALRRLSTPSTVPVLCQYFAANSLFPNTLRISLYF
jgi:hypothetical protein